VPTSADTVLRLACDGSDGSTTFTDLSSSGLTVTAVGDAQVDTGQSKWGGASLQLDGAGDYLSIASTAEFGFGTGPWTVEAWVRRTTTNSTQTLFDFRSGVAANHARIYLADWRLAYFGASTVRGGSGTTVPLNTWTHVAWCYDGTTLRAFLNGVQQWAVAFTPDFSTTRALTIGADYAGANTFTGHIDDIRVSAAAWYTANFVAPLAPLETLFVDARVQVASPLGIARVMGPAAIADPFYDDVVALLHFDGVEGSSVFTDSSVYADDFTTAYPLQNYLDPGVFGQALNCSGFNSGISQVVASALDPRHIYGTGDLTVEGRIKRLSGSAGILVELVFSIGGSGYWRVLITAAGFLQWQRTNPFYVVGTFTTTVAIPLNEWTSWAICRNAGILRVFINGSIVMSLADTVDFTPAAEDVMASLDVCKLGDGTLFDELRITNGVGRYTTDYTPRTAAFLEGPPQPEALVAVESPLGAPAALVTITPVFVYAVSVEGTTAFGSASTLTFFSASSTGPGTTFGSAAHEADRSASATGIAPSTAIGDAQAVRGIPLLPPGATTWLAPSTVFGVAALQATSYNTATGDSATAVPPALARLRQPASGFVAGNFGSAVSALSAGAAGFSGTAFGIPTVVSVRATTGTLFGAFGLPAVHAWSDCVASGWAATGLGVPSAATALGRTRSAVLRPTFGRAQAERTAP